MRPLRVLLCFSLFAVTDLQAQWEMQLDLQNLTYLDRIFFLNENLGWAIGGSSIGSASPYFYTTDGGEHWHLDDEWWDLQGTDIVFINSDTGFIAGPDGIIYRTLDNGQSWTGIQTPATQNVIHLFFVDENNGWATLGSNSYGHILKSDNCGDDWVLLEPLCDGTQSIYFINNNNGWLAGTSICLWGYSNDN